MPLTPEPYNLQEASIKITHKKYVVSKPTQPILPPEVMITVSSFMISEKQNIS